MNLREETEDIIKNRPTKADKARMKADAKAGKARRGIPEKRRAFPRKKGYIAALLLMGLAAIAFLLMLIMVDTFPADLTFILIGLMLVLLFTTCFLFSSRYRWKRIAGILVSLVFMAVIVSVTGFMYSTYAMLSKISGGGLEATGPAARSVNVAEEPFNVYITGIDQWETEKGMDLERSDVNMIVTVNPVTKKVMLTSIPRDTYVKLHTAQQMDKLTHTGVYGVDETLYTVEDWLGIDINYYVKMNFTAVRDIINAMGGIRVYSPVAFDSSLRDYHYEKGWNDLGGREALFFARERHAFEGEDAIRVENQQRVMKAIIKKMTSSTTLLTSYGDIMDAAGDNMTTNMSADEMMDLAKMQITDLASWDVDTQKIRGEYDMDYVASLSSKRQYSIYRADGNSVKEIIKGIKETEEMPSEDLKDSIRGRSRSFVVNLVNRLSEEIANAKEAREKEKEEDK